VAGHHFGNASGMAPHAQYDLFLFLSRSSDEFLFFAPMINFNSLYCFLLSIAVYKALYKSFGGFAADVVAAIDQVNIFLPLL
jgi:hypothetical protein